MKTGRCSIETSYEHNFLANRCLYVTRSVYLGRLYALGSGGVPLDEREAVHLYKLAADQGLAEAQYELGSCYDLGIGGLPQDYREALRLYKLAADQGELRPKVGDGMKG